MLYLVLTNGLIDSINPCAIGVLILYVSLLVTIQALKRQILGFGVVYIASMFLAYFLIGLGILRAFHLFGIHDFFAWVAAILVMIVGAFNIKEYFWPRLWVPYISPLLSRCRVPRGWDGRVTLGSALVLGVLVGLCEFPCSGGIYLATVALLTLKETFWKGLGYLFVYNIMFILPLVFIFSVSTRPPILKTLQRWQHSTYWLTKLSMGVTMVLMGVIIIIWIP
ncbi:MAG: hypothetical protein HY664_07095 [Chloroflexi bacterium]|nr:hypothetical protein [Chloroflexota bacterium]